MTLLAKLIAVGEDCAVMAKDGENKSQHYQYHSAAAIAARFGASCRKHGVVSLPTRIAFTTSAAGYARARDAGAAAFAPDEYEAVALAAEHGRAGAGELAAWCARKGDGGFVVDARVAMGGADGLVPHHEVYAEQRAGRGRWQAVLVRTVPRAGAQPRTTLTFGELLERLGAELVGVEVHERTAARSEGKRGADDDGARACDAAALASI